MHLPLNTVPIQQNTALQPKALLSNMSNPGSKPKKHATAKPANSDKRHFPNEIWYIVLEHFRNLSSPGELTWLWLGGRHVSQLFRIEIENFFRTIHLPLTTIRVDLGRLMNEGLCPITIGEIHADVD